MTFQSRVQPARAQPDLAALPAEPPQAPLKMPRQTLERAPGQFSLWLSGLMARLTAGLRGSLRRAG